MREEKGFRGRVYQVMEREDSVGNSGIGIENGRIHSNSKE